MAKLDKPGALALSEDKKSLFSIGRVADENGKTHHGGLFSLRVEKDFSLTAISSSTWEAPSACFVYAHKNGKNCFVANYANGSVSSFKVDSEGRLSPPVSTIRHQGSSVHEQRQKRPHAHSIYTSPDGVFVYAADLGIDQVICYQLDQTSAELKQVSEAKVPAGSGPRHMTFNQDGSILYVLNELSLNISSFSRNAEDGSLRIITTKPATISMDGRFSCSEIRISDDNKYLYVAKRDLDKEGRDLICVLDPDSLELIQEHPAGGSIPRHFNISPSGKWLVVAAQKSHQVIVHKRDQLTGKLSATEFKSTVQTPSWILFP